MAFFSIVYRHSKAGQPSGGAAGQSKVRLVSRLGHHARLLSVPLSAHFPSRLRVSSKSLIHKYARAHAHTCTHMHTHAHRRVLQGSQKCSAITRVFFHSQKPIQINSQVCIFTHAITKAKLHLSNLSDSIQ